MSKAVNGVKKEIASMRENEIIVASELYSKTKNISELAFYKTLQRMTESGELVHITKGIYCKPKYTKYGHVPFTEENVFSYYLKNNMGMKVGYYLYNSLGITTQVPNVYRIFSNRLIEEKKKIKNVEIVKVSLDLTTDVVGMIEAFEVLQNYEKIEDLNIASLAEYMKRVAENYKDETATYVLSKLKYKKSTIASMNSLLNYFGVKNELERYLSSLSQYRTIPVKEIYESARI